MKDFPDSYYTILEKFRQEAKEKSTPSHRFISMCDSDLISCAKNEEKRITTNSLGGCSCICVGFKHPDGTNYGYLSHIGSKISDEMDNIKRFLANSRFRESEIVCAKIWMPSIEKFKYFEIALYASYSKKFDIEIIEYSEYDGISEITMKIPTFEVKQRY
jgi:hypothetical protein